MGKPAILLVDDQKSIIDLEKSFLKGADLQIITASTGSEALQSIIKERPDVVFLDLMLPGMNGDAVCNFVKNNGPAGELIIVHSAVPDQANLLKQRLSELVPEEKIIIAQLGAGLGVHGGPGVLLVALRRSDGS